MESDNKQLELLVKCEEMQNSIDQVKDYIKRQKEVDASMEQMRVTEKETKEQHAKELSAMDRKKAIEIDLLKKDMQQKIKETRDNLRLKTKDQLDTTTKRTIMENEQMTTELAFQSREMEKLVQKNNSLLEENENLRRNVRIHKELEQELAKRTHLYQKTIKRLNDEKEGQTRAASKDASSGFSETPEPHIDPKELDDVRKQLSQTRHDFSEYRRDHHTFNQLHDDATKIIITTLSDFRTDDSPLSPNQREQFLRTLVEKLNASLCGTCQGPPVQIPTTKLGGITKKVEEMTNVVSRGIQTSGEEEPIRIGPSVWSWTAGGDETLSKADVVRGPVREWGVKRGRGTRV